MYNIQGWAEYIIKVFEIQNILNNLSEILIENISNNIFQIQVF